MGRPLDKEASEPEAPAAPADDRPGRVEFDSRGNSVWRWARDVLDSTSLMLKRLENKDLALEPTQKVRAVGKPDKSRSAAPGKATAAAPASARGAPQGGKPAKPGRDLDLDDNAPTKGGGFDPYNSR